MSKRRKSNSRRRKCTKGGSQRSGRVTPSAVDVSLLNAPVPVQECLTARSVLFEAYEHVIDALSDERSASVSEQLVEGMLSAVPPSEDHHAICDSICQDDLAHWYDRWTKKFEAYDGLKKASKRMGYQLDSDPDDMFTLYLTCGHAACTAHDLQTLSDQVSVPSADQVRDAVDKSDAISQTRGWKSREKNTAALTFSDLIAAT